MGELTPHLDLYKPDETELVDVAEHLNENFDKIDANSFSVDSRLGTLEGALGIEGDWEDFVTSFVFGGVTIGGATWQRSQVLKVGSLVYVDIRCTIPSATYDDGADIRITLPFRTVSSILGTGLLEKNPNVNPALAGPKVPYYYVSGPATGSSSTATSYPLVSTPPIEIDWDAPHDSSLFTATYIAFLNYRTDE